MFLNFIFFIYTFVILIRTFLLNFFVIIYILYPLLLLCYSYMSKQRACWVTVFCSQVFGRCGFPCRMGRWETSAGRKSGHVPCASMSEWVWRLWPIIPLHNEAHCCIQVSMTSALTGIWAQMLSAQQFPAYRRRTHSQKIHPDAALWTNKHRTVPEHKKYTSF